MALIFIVDDDKDNIRLLQRLLRDEHDIEVAWNGKEALEKIRELKPDLVLLDVMMPEFDGFEVCSALKQDKESETFIPVILVSAKDDYQSRIKGYDCGADDYITKPFHNKELRAKVNIMLRIKTLQDQLQRQNKELSTMAITDPLSGLFNRRYFYDRLENEFQRSKRFDTPLACLMIDIDHFKVINDRYGHQFGDMVITNLAVLLRENCRIVDTVCRYGGEEFAIIMPNSNLDEALQLGWRLREKVALNPFCFHNRIVFLTISIGVSNFPGPRIHTIDDLIRIADNALYDAKRGGRNTVKHRSVKVS